MSAGTADRDDRWDAGLAVRRSVLGDAYVDASLAGANGLSEPLQRLVTEFVWGSIWTRPGLSRETRSMLNIGMLIALNQPHELKAHVRGALRNGVTPDEIVEVVLQSMVYCGAPAALAGMRVVQDSLSEASVEGVSAADHEPS